MRLFFGCIFSLVLAFAVSEESESDKILAQQVENLKTTFGCSSTVNGNSYDLSKMTGDTDFSAQDAAYATNKYMYYLNPCGVAHGNVGKCNDGFATYCQVGTSTSPSNANLGTATIPSSGNQPNPPTWSLIDPNRPATGVQVTYANGDSCNAPNAPPKKIGVINFYCDPNAGRGRANGTVSESPTCSFTINILTSTVCTGGNGGGGGESKGISGGWVFIIILIVLIFLYIVAGCIYQRKKKGATGVESCPNIEFWRGLPILVKEGFTFTWSKIRGLCGKGEYQEVK